MPYKAKDMQILKAVAETPKPFSRLKKELGISANVLSFNLKKLVSQGALEKSGHGYRILPFGVLRLNNAQFNAKDRIHLYRITNGVTIPLPTSALKVPIDVFLIANGGLDLKIATQNMAATLNTLIPTLIYQLSDEVARQRGLAPELPLEFKHSVIANKQKYDFEATIVIHYNGHEILEKVNWDALAKTAEALDNQVKAGMDIIRRNLHNSEFKEKLKASFVERFGEKLGQEVFNALLETLGFH